MAPEMGDPFHVCALGICKDLKGPFFKTVCCPLQANPGILQKGPVPEDVPRIERSQLFMKFPVAQEKLRKQYCCLQEQGHWVGLTRAWNPSSPVANYTGEALWASTVSSGNWHFKLTAHGDIGRIQWSRLCKGFSRRSDSRNNHITMCYVAMPWARHIL